MHDTSAWERACVGACELMSVQACEHASVRAWERAAQHIPLFLSASRHLAPSVLFSTFTQLHTGTPLQTQSQEVRVKESSSQSAGSKSAEVCSCASPSPGRQTSSRPPAIRPSGRPTAFELEGPSPSAGAGARGSPPTAWPSRDDPARGQRAQAHIKCIYNISSVHLHMRELK